MKKNSLCLFFFLFLSVYRLLVDRRKKKKYESVDFEKLQLSFSTVVYTCSLNPLFSFHSLLKGCFLFYSPLRDIAVAVEMLAL